jgi:hypothetical protein
MPLTPDIINLTGTPHQNIGQLFDYLISKGWTNAGTQTLSFYYGSISNPNIQFRGIKNASGQIIYYNTTNFTINNGSASFVTAIINLSQNNTNNNFITSPNEFFNASCVFPTNTSLNSNQITPAYIFYDTKNFILIIKNTSYSYENFSNNTFLDYPNYYKVLGYLELGTSGQYRVLFNDFVIPDNKFTNYRNVVVWYNNQLYTNHIYPFNTLVSHNITQAANNIHPLVYSQKRVKIGYFDEVGMTTHTARAKLIFNDSPVANLPITINKDLNVMERVATINGQVAHIIPVYNFQDAAGNVKYIHLIIFPNAI